MPKRHDRSCNCLAGKGIAAGATIYFTAKSAAISSGFHNIKTNDQTTARSRRRNTIEKGRWLPCGQRYSCCGRCLAPFPVLRRRRKNDQIWAPPPTPRSASPPVTAPPRKGWERVSYLVVGVLPGYAAADTDSQLQSRKGVSFCGDPAKQNSPPRVV
jgi:hypothetical protein